VRAQAKRGVGLLGDASPFADHANTLHPAGQRKHLRLQSLRQNVAIERMDIATVAWLNSLQIGDE
jgi:hypothetical protein